MLTLRCTKRLAQRLGVKLTKNPSETTGKLGDWFANIIDIPIPIVVCANAMTRLALVIPALEPIEVIFQFRIRLANLLSLIGIDNEAIHKEITTTEIVTFAPTNDRKVVGSLTDICFHVSWWLEDQGAVFTNRELLKFEKKLAGMPHVKLKEPFPERAVLKCFSVSNSLIT
ncbi:MAG: hypothetical protein JW841_11090 [Deltaproteobacteria bacterium]|nr:hypothetical protein [Deltaproteobacteria bacterium]